MPGSPGSPGSTRLRRVGTERGVSVRFNASGTLMGCHGTGKSVEVYRRRAPAEILKKMKRRFKRLREKKRQRDEAASKVSGAALHDDASDADADADAHIRVEDATTSDEFALVGVVRCPSPSPQGPVGVPQGATRSLDPRRLAGLVAVACALLWGLHRCHGRCCGAGAAGGGTGTLGPRRLAASVQRLPVCLSACPVLSAGMPAQPHPYSCHALSLYGSLRRLLPPRLSGGLSRGGVEPVARRWPARAVG